MASQVEDIKWLPSATDRRFMVDGFNFKTPTCSTYFLTHFHSDHTWGLTKGLAEYGVIHTSEVTARLLIHDKGFPARAVRAYPLHTPFELCGCRIRLIDANHCPGAVMLLVEVLADRAGAPLEKPQVILHTGDCRWEDRLAEQIPKGLRVDTIYLDTTYSIPRYTFPPQVVVIDCLAEEIRQMLVVQPRSLLVVAAYHIGKEKVFLGLARRLGIKVWCSASKRKVLQLLDLDPHDLALLTTQPQEAGLLVIGWGMRPDQLQQKFLKAAEDAGLQVNPDAATEGVGETAAAGAAAAPPQAAAGGSSTEDAGADELMHLVKQEEKDGQATGPYEDPEEEAAAVDSVRGHWTNVIGIKATGWTFRKRSPKLISKWVTGPVTVLGAPYSEHSSFAELCSCVKLLKPSRIIPTANASDAAASKAIVERFVGLMDLSRQRGRMDMYLRKSSSLPAAGNTLLTPPSTGQLAPSPTQGTPKTDWGQGSIAGGGKVEDVVTIELSSDGEQEDVPPGPSNQAALQALPAPEEGSGQRSGGERADTSLAAAAGSGVRGLGTLAGGSAAAACPSLARAAATTQAPFVLLAEAAKPQSAAKLDRSNGQAEVRMPQESSGGALQECVSVVVAQEVGMQAAPSNEQVEPGNHSSQDIKQAYQTAMLPLQPHPAALSQPQLAGMPASEQLGEALPPTPAAQVQAPRHEVMLIDVDVCEVDVREQERIWNMIQREQPKGVSSSSNGRRGRRAGSTKRGRSAGKAAPPEGAEGAIASASIRKGSEEAGVKQSAIIPAMKRARTGSPSGTTPSNGTGAKGDPLVLLDDTTAGMKLVNRQSSIKSFLSPK